MSLLTAVIDPAAYVDNVYALPPRVTAIATLVLGVLILWRERGSRIGLHYFLFVLSVFIWLLSQSLTISASSYEVAIFWTRVSQAGVLLMYPTIYHFGVMLLGIDQQKKAHIVVAWSLASVFIVTTVFTGVYVQDLYRYDWGWYPKYELWPIVWLIVSSYFIVTGSYFILQTYLKAEPGTINYKRAKGMLIGFGFAMCAFMDVVPAFGIDMYPLGHTGILIDAAITMALTWRYRLVDITPQFAAKEIIDTMSDALLVLDSDKVIRLANPEAERLFGRSLTELTDLGLSAALLDHRAAGGIEAAHWGEDVRNAEVLLSDPNGRERVINLSVSVMRAGEQKPLAYICVMRDITEQKRVQEELEHRVMERTAELAIARDQALEASRTKSAFLANMSHELRTPLNAIIGYSELLAEKADESNVPELSDDLQKITRSGSHLLELINTVLDLSKVEAGKMELYLEDFEAKIPIEEVVEAFQALSKKNGNQLIAYLPPDLGTIRADSTKIRQALMNLVSNACKFTENGVIEVHAERSVLDDAEWICISVEDSGIGMDRVEQEKLFSEFTQASTTTSKKYGGSGLGLAISQRFCQLMGGAITVESTVGEGSQFTICLPVDVETAIAAREND